MIVSSDLGMPIHRTVANGILGLSNWLINAFNGEWLRTEHAVPKAQVDSLTRVR